MNSSLSYTFAENQGESWAHRHCFPGTLARNPAVSSHHPITTRFRHLPSKVKADLPHPMTPFYITCNKMSMSFTLHLFIFHCLTLVSLAFSLPYKLSPIWIIITSYSDLRQLRPTWWRSPSLTFYPLILLRTQHHCLIYLCFPSSWY